MQESTPCANKPHPVGDRVGPRDLSYGSSYIMAPRATKTIAWADFARTAETGDIILYSGQSFISAGIRFAEGWSQWSHIGMVVRQAPEPRPPRSPGDDDGEDGNEENGDEGGRGRVMILEATTADGEVDLMSGRRIGGVRLVDAELAIRHYLRAAENAVVVARHLFFDEAVLGKEVDPAARLPDLRRFIAKVAHLPYERNPFEMLRALARGLQLITTWRTESSYFCSELVAQAYMTLGLLRDGDPAHPTASLPPYEADPRREGGAPEGWLDEWFELASRRSASLYTPKDFAQESQDLPFLYDKRTNANLVDLGPHLRIVFPDAGPDPLKNPPPRMSAPQRPRLRMHNLVAPRGK